MTHLSQGEIRPESAPKPAAPAFPTSTVITPNSPLDELEALAHGFDAVGMLLQSENDLDESERYCLGAFLQYLSRRQQEALQAVRTCLQPSNPDPVPEARSVAIFRET